MKKLLYLLPLLFVISMAANAGVQDFTLVNETGVTIHEFHCSTVNTEKWEEDILGQDVLENGQSVDIKFHAAEDDCNWDLMVKDSDGNSLEWNNIDLCNISKITLKWDGKEGTAELTPVEVEGEEEAE
jgi:hypothetical protein